MKTFCIIWPIASYLAGSIPFGLIFAKIKGVDLTGHGSGNIGATNVARVMGKGMGLMTLLADFIKGLLPVLILRFLCGGDLSLSISLALTGFSAVLGHCYSVFLGFRGGKGVATSAGVFLGICPQALGVAAAAFLAVVKVTGFVSAGSLLAAVVLPVGIHFFCPSGQMEAMASAVAAIVWWKHRGNMARLLRGQERGWRKA
ncbi:MAG: glycerol-3-phosphate 1-O-acyltransferase PlsY [Desulfobacteraceae bacterium]|nr:glycerol-3-phosphate 1-O-acyltransferase PlsY [Desulfobacteraceae bacterium]